ncbi:hypothetical protein V7968_31670 [Nocardia vulneris]|uniref:hypothetical protein n=1 Tax=Nocardia TaxID=1817 RepID=UPI0030D4B736
MSSMDTETVSSLGPICDYCLQENLPADTRCARCGAPLPPEQLASDPLDAPEQRTGPVIEEKVLPHPGVQWRASVGAVAHKADNGLRNPGRIIAVILGTGTGIVLVVGGLIVAAVMVLIQLLPSFSAPDVARGTAPRSWADQLRAVSTCQRIHVDERCVLTGGHYLLFGGITGGRDLIFWIRQLPEDPLGVTVRRWRAEGGRILCDKATFIQISPTAAVRYASGPAGVVVETDPFTDSARAQAFLTRFSVFC